MTAVPGLTTIVGPQSASAANHVQNMANQMHVPHIETRFDYAPQTPAFSINVHPHPSVLGKAYADLIQALGWKSLAILFQTEDSLVKLQEVLKLPQTFEDVKITLRQLDLTTDDYRPLLKVRTNVIHGLQLFLPNIKRKFIKISLLPILFCLRVQYISQKEL